MVKISKKIAKRFLDLSLNPVPVEYGSKAPKRMNHNLAIPLEELDNFNWSKMEIGVSTGFSSGSLEVLDFDLKNAEDPKMFMKEFDSLVPQNLLKRLVMQSTPSGGFHYIYRCDKIESNQKLARNKDGAATIETRGIGGYIKCYPSEGYNIVSEGSFDSIPYISESERNLLFTLARQKDELLQEDITSRLSDEDRDYLVRFPEYNNDERIGIEMLEDNGWTYHSENGDWYNMTRPNSDSGDLHGGYNLEGKFFQVFSTAQDTFHERRGYNNHAIFAELECGGNYKVAYGKLYDMGYGVDVDEEDEGDFKFLSTYEQENEYLEQLRKGEVPVGVSTGWHALDQNFKWKKNTFYFWLGLDNIGKSTLSASMTVASNVLHGYKWGIHSPEALVHTTRRNLLEAEAGKKVSDMSKAEKDDLIKSSRSNFYIISNDKHYTITDVLLKGKKLYERYGIDFLILDPFSFYSGSGSFTEDTDVLSKIRVFCQKYCSVVVVDHPFTQFTRTGKGDDGFLRIPRKYDASGGNSKANRCDDFICFHRVVNHTDSEIRRTMQVLVEKVKDKSTGGEPHQEGDWGELVYESKNGFLGYWDSEGNNPMYKVKSAREGVRETLRLMSPDEVF